MKQIKQFTLIELLLVITIIAILASMLLPTLSKVRKKAKSIQCKSNLAQIGFATMQYAEDFSGWAPITSTENTSYTFTNYHIFTSYLSITQKTPGQNLLVAPVALCPTKKWSNADLGMGEYWADWWAASYSYNAHMTNQAWLSIQPELLNKMTNVKNSSTRLLCADSFKLVPNSLDTITEFDFRHQKMTNILYVDGHAGQKRLAEIPISRFANNDPENFYNNKQ